MSLVHPASNPYECFCLTLRFIWRGIFQAGKENTSDDQSNLLCGTCPQYQKKKKKKKTYYSVTVQTYSLKNLEINIRKLNKTKPLRNLTECCDLKQIDCQSFLQQRWVYQKSAEICSSGSATKRSHVQVPMWCRKNA